MSVTESVNDFLERRERELQHELEQVRKAREALGPVAPPNSLAGNSNALAYQGAVYAAQRLRQLESSYTIKQMILYALGGHFREGATPSQLRDYMRTAYGREIDRNSISPQLTRLRAEGSATNRAGLWVAVPHDHP